MKRLVFAAAGLILESLGWTASVFFCVMYGQYVLQERLGEAFRRTNGAAARPYLALYFFAVFLLLTLCALLLNRFAKRRDRGVMLPLTLGNLVWLGCLLGGYVLRYTFTG